MSEFYAIHYTLLSFILHYYWHIFPSREQSCLSTSLVVLESSLQCTIVSKTGKATVKMGENS